MTTVGISRKIALGIAAAAAVASTVMGGVAVADPAPSSGDSSHGDHNQSRDHDNDGAPQHIFYIMMENHGFSQIIGNNADAPFINGLAAKYNVETGFHGVTHPSLPNYLSMFSGSFQGIWDDCKAGSTVTCAPEEFVPNSGDGTDKASLTPDQVKSASATPHMFAGRNLVDELETKGKSWKAYMQSMPSAGYTGEYAPGTMNGTLVKLYAQKHNPFMYFSDITSSSARMQRIVPFENNFDADLASGAVPDFSWISPDQCHDMHTISPAAAALINQPNCATPASGLDHGGIQLGDQYLRDTVGKIMASSTWKNSRSSIVIAWDENDYSGYSGGPGSPVGANGAVLGGGDAPLIVINSKDDDGHKTVSKDADHYTVLSTIEQMWQLGCLVNTCSPTTSGSLREMFGN